MTTLKVGIASYQEMKARTMAMQTTGPGKAAAENQLSQTLKSLFAVAENYPQLKANENFLNLQNELTVPPFIEKLIGRQTADRQSA